MLGKPPPGMESSFGHLITKSDWRDVRPKSFSGNARRFSQFERRIEESFGVGRPPGGKVVRFGQSLISRDLSAIRSSPSPAWMEKVLKLSQAVIERDLSFGKRDRGKVMRLLLQLVSMKRCSSCE